MGQPIYKNEKTDLKKWDNRSTKIGQPIHDNYDNLCKKLQLMFPIEIMVIRSIFPICKLSVDRIVGNSDAS